MVLAGAAPNMLRLNCCFNYTPYAGYCDDLYVRKEGIWRDEVTLGFVNYCYFETNYGISGQKAA